MAQCASKSLKSGVLELLRVPEILELVMVQMLVLLNKLKDVWMLLELSDVLIILSEFSCVFASPKTSSWCAKGSVQKLIGRQRWFMGNPVLSFERLERALQGPERLRLLRLPWWCYFDEVSVVPLAAPDFWTRSLCIDVTGIRVLASAEVALDIAADEFSNRRSWLVISALLGNESKLHGSSSWDSLASASSSSSKLSSLSSSSYSFLSVCSLLLS